MIVSEDGTPLIPVGIPDLPNDGWATLLLEVYEQDGRKICGIRELRGELDLPPKSWLRTVRAEMVKLEGLIRQSGCNEIRLAGRWRGVFPGYEPFDGLDRGYRKVLLDG